MRIPHTGSFGTLSVIRKGGLGIGPREFVLQLKLDADAVIDIEIAVDAEQFGSMLCEDGYDAECKVCGDVTAQEDD